MPNAEQKHFRAGLSRILDSATCGIHTAEFRHRFVRKMLTSVSMTIFVASKRPTTLKYDCFFDIFIVTYGEMYLSEHSISPWVIAVATCIIAFCSSGCYIYIPYGEYQDGKSSGKNVIASTVTVERGDSYVFEKQLINISQPAYVVTGGFQYGLTERLDISYTTWYSSFPMLNSKVSLKYSLLSSNNVYAALHIAGIYSVSGIETTTSYETVNKSQLYYTGILSIPVSVHRGSASFYVAPRIWLGKYAQRYRYNRYTDDALRRWEYGEDTSKRLSITLLSAAMGFRFPTPLVTVIPEMILMHDENDLRITYGVRLAF